MSTNTNIKVIAKHPKAIAVVFGGLLAISGRLLEGLAIIAAVFILSRL